MFLRKTCLNLAAAVFGITGGTGLPSSSFITCRVSSTGLPSCLDPSAELVGVRVTRWERHYPDLILSNLRHLRHAQRSQPCFQFKGILDELALSYCRRTDNAKRKRKAALEGFKHLPKVLQKFHLCYRIAQTIVKEP